MLRGILLLTAIVGCSGDDGPHDVQDSCDWAAPMIRCELACVAETTGQPNDTCSISDGPSKGAICTGAQITTYDGQRGCCITDGSGEAPVIRFVECE